MPPFVEVMEFSSLIETAGRRLGTRPNRQYEARVALESVTLDDIGNASSAAVARRTSNKSIFPYITHFSSFVG
jgi:hypothetical protein